MAGQTKRKNSILLDILQKYVIIFVFVICILVFGIINPKFFSGTNILNIFYQNSYLVVATLGMVFLLLSGGVDLAAGYDIEYRRRCCGGMPCLVAPASLGCGHRRCGRRCFAELNQRFCRRQIPFERHDGHTRNNDHILRCFEYLYESEGNFQSSGVL